MNVRHRTRPAAFASLAVLSLLGALLATVTPAAATTPPHSNFSYYVNDDTSKMQTLGCNQGTRDTSLGVNSLVFLDFGGQTGTGSTKLIGGVTIPYSEMRWLTAWFAYGYNGCVSGFATTLALGTNNSLNVTTGMGSGWADAVVGANSDVIADGYGGTVSVIGANDFEPDFSTASAARAWMGGYDGYSGHLFVYNFGAASGCPTTGTGGCNHSWTQNDIYYLSWGASPAYPVPEIYNNTMALQWKNITVTQGAMNFPGTMSQGYACSQVGGCSGTNFGPDASWNALANATGQTPTYSCNIGYSQLA